MSLNVLTKTKKKGVRVCQEKRNISKGEKNKKNMDIRILYENQRKDDTGLLSVIVHLLL